MYIYCLNGVTTTAVRFATSPGFVDSRKVQGMCACHRLNTVQKALGRHTHGIPRLWYAMNDPPTFARRYLTITVVGTKSRSRSTEDTVRKTRSPEFESGRDTGGWYRTERQQVITRNNNNNNNDMPRTEREIIISMCEMM